MKYDLHIHTNHSDAKIDLKTLLKEAKRKNLDGIAITDHNTAKGAFIAKKMNKDRNFEVIVGSEIKTNYGDVLAYYLNEDIKERDFFDVIDKAKEQDAIMSIAHPYRLLPPMRFGCDIAKIKNKIHALETFNARTILGGNSAAKSAAKKYNLAETAGSDAHFVFNIGDGVTVFEDNLRKAIKKRTTKTEGSMAKTPLFMARYVCYKIFRI